jgi:ribonuclease HIII
MSSEYALNEEIRRYWEGGGTDLASARSVLGQALADPPQSPDVLARAIAVISRADAEGFAPSVREKLIDPMGRLRKLVALVDALGDDNIEPAAAVFDHLADWVGEEQLLGADPRLLSDVRLGAASRPEAARALLEALGWERLGDDAAELSALIHSLQLTATNFPARALLLSQDRNTGLCLGVNVLAGDKPGVVGMDEADLVMQKQAKIVLSAFEPEHPAIRWSMEWALEYGGESIGVALRLAALVRFKGQRADPLLGATGAVTDDGRVRRVEGVVAKLQAARDAGIRRVLLPRENEAEAAEAGIADDVQLLFLDHVDDIPKRLAESSAANEMTFDGRIRLARSSLPLFGLTLTKERSLNHSRQLHVADGAGRAILELWRKGTIASSGAASPTRDQVNLLIAEVFVGDAPEEREGHKFTLAEDWRRQRLENALQSSGAQSQPVTGPAELMRYELRRKSSKAEVTIWTSGKGYLKGTAPAFDEILTFVSAASEGLANADATPKPKSRRPAGGNTPADLPTEGPWIGTDESGKGDYFGPLVSAAVFVNDAVAAELSAAGVQDSKKLSDKRVLALAPTVRDIVGQGRYKVTAINPGRYNELYEQFTAEGQNLNSLLAWGHTRSIEDLLGAGLKPRYAIVDQFANASYIKKRLLAEARDSGLEVFQFPKAEANVAVAAASILAREAFLLWLTRTSASLGMAVPKGASPQVEEVARTLASSRGPGSLRDLVKLHFKTTAKVLA